MEARSCTANAPRKTKPRGRHPDKALSAAFIRSAPPGRHCDGQGLYLVVQPAGTRSWVQRLVIRGRKRELGLGSTALVSLAEARERALSNRKLAREGGDPLAEKRRADAMPTFADAAARVVEQKRAGWRSPVHARTWLNSLELHAFPRIGGRPVSEVTSADVLDVLTPIWHVKAQTARNVRQRISAVMEWAIAVNLRSDNPCARVLPVLGKQNEVVRHMRALPHRDVAAAVATVRASNAAEAVRLAFEFLVLTAARWGEVRWARWTEMDMSAHVWTIPATRMKANREHRVPLCRRAVEIVDAARALGDGVRPLVFTNRDGEPLEEKVLRRLLERQRVSAVPHGFRSSFRDWAAEETEHRREVIEAALAHVVGNKVEAAYARSDLFERRRVLMNDWAGYIERTSPAQPPALNGRVKTGQYVQLVILAGFGCPPRHPPPNQPNRKSPATEHLDHDRTELLPPRSRSTTPAAQTCQAGTGSRSEVRHTEIRKASNGTKNTSRSRRAATRNGAATRETVSGRSEHNETGS